MKAEIVIITILAISVASVGIVSHAFAAGDKCISGHSSTSTYSATARFCSIDKKDPLFSGDTKKVCREISYDKCSSSQTAFGEYDNFKPS